MTHAEEQRERREYIEDERRKRQQPSTLHQHAIADAETDRGRFTAIERATVIGSTPLPQYPQLPSGPWSGEDLVGIEPPLGFEIHAMASIDPSPVFIPVEAPGPASADAPSVLTVPDVQRADAGQLSDPLPSAMAAGGAPVPSATSPDVEQGGAASSNPKLASVAPTKPSFTRSPQGRLTFGYEVVPGLRRKRW
jgi:hypothetical protein